MFWAAFELPHETAATPDNKNVSPLHRVPTTLILFLLFIFSYPLNYTPFQTSRRFPARKPLAGKLQKYK